MQTSLKRFVKSLVPDFVLDLRSKFLSKKADQPFASLPPEDVFRTIYAKGLWEGSDRKADFFSGHGSHDPSIVGPYVESVRAFLGSFATPQVIVDLGCGDFNVGRQICDLAKDYVACDIVEDLIQRNSQLFQKPNLRFVSLNAIDDQLPEGDIVIIRQVLQHLSNDQIRKIVDKITKYKFVVITEHLPKISGFEPNLDKPAGPGIRLGIDSGVVLTEAPFSLVTKSSNVLCEVEKYGGIIRTAVYRLPSAPI